MLLGNLNNGRACEVCAISSIKMEIEKFTCTNKLVMIGHKLPVVLTSLGLAFEERWEMTTASCAFLVGMSASVITKYNVHRAPH